MRLAYVTSRFPFAYIGETFFVPEVRLLSRLCDEVHVIPARPKYRDSVFGDLGTIDVGTRPTSGRTLVDAVLEGIAHPSRAALALRRILSPRYAMAAKVRNLVLFPKALAVARYARKHKIDHIHALWLSTPATIAYIASIMTDISWSCTAHAHDIYCSDNLLGVKVRSARFVRVIGERHRTHLARETGIDPHDLQLLHLGVELAAVSSPFPETDRPLQIACVARLHPMKGLDQLLASLAMVRDRGVAFHCDIAGDGPLFNQLRATIAKLQLEAFVTLRGLVEHHTVLEELRGGRYDVMVLPSVELEDGLCEGIPVALMEAMAATIPCIATATGCTSDLIDAQSGLLVRERDPRALAAAIVRIAEDRAFARELGRAARERVEADFNVEKQTRALYDLMRENVKYAYDSPIAGRLDYAHSQAQRRA